mmetsp:Transcript_153993/g.492310  ORF Transcript_153993/g.492310 Transcript_153993/m.492310 type:complete len:446 (-) Transcript_153993:420-1757(-)
MGMLERLNIFRRSSKSSTTVETFTAAEEEVDEALKELAQMAPGGVSCEKEEFGAPELKASSSPAARELVQDLCGDGDHDDEIEFVTGRPAAAAVGRAGPSTPERSPVVAAPPPVSPDASAAAPARKLSSSLRRSSSNLPKVAAPKVGLGGAFGGKAKGSAKAGGEDACDASLEVVPAAAGSPVPPMSLDGSRPGTAEKGIPGDEAQPSRDFVLGPSKSSPRTTSPRAASKKSFMDAIHTKQEDSGPLPKTQPCKPRAGLQLQSLCIRGRTFQGMKTPEPQLPGALQEEDPDEFFMDGILEEAGMVFGATGTVSNMNPFGSSGRNFAEDQPVGPGVAMMGMSSSSFVGGLGMTAMSASSMPDVGISMSSSNYHLTYELSQLEQDHIRLEEELMAMGLDMEDLDEQQAMLNSLQRRMEIDADEEVAVLLDSLQGDLSLSSLQSIECW